jgi:quercetin dioxygenase-like cupin family protein
MEIKRAGAEPSGKGPAAWFTGAVRIDPLFNAPDPARAVGAVVTFEPGARTAWHTHPLAACRIPCWPESVFEKGIPARRKT